MPQPHVVILLASCQGAAHLPAQLHSIAGQTHSNWSLIVSDDGSADGTRDIVAEFGTGHRRDRVALIDGPRTGATMNFLSLLDHVPAGALAAFCDQDDLWFPDKLARAVDALTLQGGPAHYAARTIITDQNLCPVTGSRHFHRPLGIRNALVQACMAGNTSVFNPASVTLLQQAAPHARRAGIISHDWWAYQVLAAADARLIHDRRPALLYRQHPKSAVGRNDTLPALSARLRKLLAGEFGTWLRANCASLTPLDLPQSSRTALEHLDRMLTRPGPQALRALRQGRFYRQTTAGTAALALSAMTGALHA